MEPVSILPESPGSCCPLINPGSDVAPSAAFSLNGAQSINGNQMQPSPSDRSCLFPLCLIETQPWGFLLPLNNIVPLP